MGAWDFHDDAARRYPRTSGLYEVGAHLVLPEGRDVDVERTPPADERHADLTFAPRFTSYSEGDREPAHSAGATTPPRSDPPPVTRDPHTVPLGCIPASYVPTSKRTLFR